MKPGPAIVLLIAGSALAGWLLTLIPSPAHAAGVDLPALADSVASLLCRLLQDFTALLRRF